MSGLTKAQTTYLEAARDGVLGFGPHRQVQDRMRLMGYVEMGNLGYYVLTEAGRAALSQSPLNDKKEG